MIVVRLFGSPLILRNDQPVMLARRRNRALLYYLAAHPQPVRREQVLALFWPDYERGAAQQLLRSTLYTIRRAVGEALVADDEWLSLAASVDLRALHTVVADPQASPVALAAALPKEAAELLAGFELPDCEPFQFWLEGVRVQARALVGRGWLRLARLYEQAGELTNALNALDAALSIDPLQEDVQRDAMRIAYLSGDRVGAIRRFEQLRTLLDQELGVPPMRETQALYDAIITDTLAALPPARRFRSQAANGLLPFTGRETELALLQTEARPGRLLLIEGVPGIGKTRLAEEFLVRRGGLVMIGAARELEQNLPYHPISAALAMLAAHPEWPALRARLSLAPIWWNELGRLLPDLAAPPVAPPDEARLWEAITRLFIAVANHTPLSLLIDDIQWADASTLGLLGYLLRRSAEADLVVVATTRLLEPRSPLAGLIRALVREERLFRLSLDRLAPVATLAIARHLSPPFAHPLAGWLEQSAEGNPYIIAELVRHARAAGWLTADGMVDLRALSAQPVVPQTVYHLIETRLSRLSDPARRMLDAAVAIGRDFDFVVAARAAALSEEAALDALDELLAMRLVLPLAAGRFRFDHSLTVEVAYREVGELRHRMLHRRVGEALETIYRDRLDDLAGQIAFHFAEGGLPERAASYALRAGDRAAALAAWPEAAEFYAQALTGAPAAQRVAILLKLGEARLQSGAAALAAEAFRDAIAAAQTPRDALVARLALARALIPQGRYADVIALVSRPDPSAHPQEQAAALFLWGTALSLEGADLYGAAERLVAAEQVLQSCPAADQAALAQVNFELGNVAAQQGDLATAIARYEAAQRIADATGDEASTWRVLARNNQAYHRLLRGEIDAAAAIITEALALAEERGLLAMQPYLLSTAGEVALAQGDLATAAARFQQGLALANQFGIPERVAGLTANLGLVATRRGETACAVHYLSTALAQADTLGARHLAAQIRIWLAPLLPLAEARAVLAEAQAIAEADGRQRLLAAIAEAQVALAERTAIPYAMELMAQ
ncbi:MAG: AAA family ATPase [Chloroflexus sp.]|nr:AAA family ATPase [Chloroflexus sp.]